jgi:hypothetical protein
LSKGEVSDAEGHGVRAVFEHTGPARATLRQIVTLYDTKPYAYVTVEIVSPTMVSSNAIAPLVAENVSVPGSDPRLLDVPFDNDEWVRYDARPLHGGAAPVTGMGYEVTALYDSGTRHSLVIGSVTHDFWKTGIDYAGANGVVTKLRVFGGVSTPDKDGTHDATAAHGAMSGTTLASPRIMIGYFDDWRAGLEEYGRANARVAPPRAWSGGVPFGWNSWGAYKSGVTADNLIATSDYIKANLQSGYPSAPYVNIDAGLKTDSEPIVAHVHANGQKAGTYAVPFTYFFNAAAGDPLTKPVGNSGYTYSDVVLRGDDGQPIKVHGNAYALDVTHPAVRTSMQNVIQSDIAKGFDFLKLDFMTDGALEGKHFDPNVHSGIQAYNQALAFLTSLIPSNVFVSLSIAPIFPTQYANARRISCDVLGQLNDVSTPTYAHYGSTEYLLNSITYGWWLSGTAIPFNDPDVMALYQYGPTAPVVKPEWSRARVTASAIAGTVFLDSTDYTNADAAQRSTFLTNSGINAIASKSTAFRPLDGADGQHATASFVRHDANETYLAIFNYDAVNPATLAIDLARADLNPNTQYRVLDVWATTPLDPATGTLNVSLDPGQVRVLKLD